MRCYYYLLLLTTIRTTWGLDAGVVEFRHAGRVGGAETVDQVFVNGVSLGSVAAVIRAVSSGSPLRDFAGPLNDTTGTMNHTLMRLRECRLEGSEVRLSDSVLYDGEVFLTLDGTGPTWTARHPAALPLKRLWDGEPERTGTETSRLREGCLKLMKEFSMKDSEANTGMPVTPVVVAPVIAVLAFVVLIMIALLISRIQGSSWHPGGVIGSVVHYPTDITELPQGTKRCGYEAI